MFWRALAGMMLILATAPCLAADIARRGDGVVFLNGPIVAGDLSRLRALAEPHSTVSLRSNGGNFPEGLAIARWFYDTRISTVIEDANECLSACAVAFLGGSALGEEGADLVARSISPDAKLGFHAPYLNLGPGRFAEADVQSYYDRAVRTIVDVVSSSTFLHIEHGDAAELMRPQRSGMVYLDTARMAGRYNVTVQGLTMPPHLTRTMVLSLCANGWDWAHNSRMIDITEKQSPDVFADGLSLLEETRWDAKDAEVTAMDGRRLLLVPLTPAILYQTMYCALSLGEPGTIDSCLGFYMGEDVQLLKDYIGANPADPEYPCRIDYVIDPKVGPDAANIARALVPPQTPLSKMADELARLAATEPPLFPQ